jgi:AcrR family transcriptional regulator
MDDQITGIRRVPRQARAQQRVEQILDSATQLYLEHGYDETTTNAIAAHSGVPIGSLYQFFSNKEAILRAVVQRYCAGMLALIDQALAGSDNETVDQLAGRLIDAMLLYGGERFGVTRIVMQMPPHPHIAAEVSQLRQELIARLTEILELRMPQRTAQQRHLTASVGLSATLALLSQSIAEKHAGRLDLAFQMIGQVRFLLMAYVRAVAEQTG